MSHADNKAQTPQRPPFMVALGLLPPYSLEDVRRAYFDRALVAHPDRGGSAEEFNKLHEAYTQATEYAGFRVSRVDWLGAWVEHYADEQRIVADIRELGGSTAVELAGAVSQSIGDDFANVFERLVDVKFSGSSQGDSVVEYLVAQHGALSGLRSLELVNCRLSDAAVARLHVLGSLRRLDLSGTPVSYRGIAPLRQLPELTWLGLERTRVPRWRRWWVGRSLRRRARARANATPIVPATNSLSLANRS